MMTCPGMTVTPESLFVVISRSFGEKELHSSIGCIVVFLKLAAVAERKVLSTSYSSSATECVAGADNIT